MTEANDDARPCVLVVSEVRVLRESLAQSLRGQAGLRRVEMAAASETCSVLGTCRPNLVLTDTALVRSTDLVARATDYGARVVVFGVREEDDAEVLACAEAGVAGFVGRDASLDDFRTARQTAASGDVHCSPRVAAVVCGRLKGVPGSRSNGQFSLTRREREIADLVGQGLSIKEIGLQLCIATATVKNHVHNLLQKQGVHRRSLAAAVSAPQAARPIRDSGLAVRIYVNARQEARFSCWRRA